MEDATALLFQTMGLLMDILHGGERTDDALSAACRVQTYPPQYL
jgi:hypothetical protein